MATAHRKQGIWFTVFPDRENTGNFAVTQRIFFRHRENILTVIINTRSMFCKSSTVSVLSCLFKKVQEQCNLCGCLVTSER